MSEQSVQEYERRAQVAEASNTPMFLKVAKGLVWFLYAVTVVTVTILVLAFVLRLVGASTDAAFTRWVYRSSESMMRPFRGIFPVAEVGEQGVSVVDVSLLFGALIYLFVALGVDALYQRVSHRLHREQVEIANARANADAVRLQFEAQQQQAAYAAQQQAQAQQFALQQEALRRQQQQQSP
jgi:uncharacterized protein YggT (Ycf19 family)